MALALLAAQPARLGTRFKSSPSHRRLELRLPGEYPARRGAHLRAVEAHGYAALQMSGHLFTEAGIGAGATRLGAVEACLYALDERTGVHGYGTRVGVEHLPGVGHGSPSSSFPS